MATYFHGAPEIQSDGLQTLYLMNPNYVGYSDTAAPTNMLLLNSTMNSLNPINLSHAAAAAAAAAQPNQQQHFVGIPLQPTVASHESNRPQSIQASQDVSAVHGLVPRVHYNLWTPTAPNSSIDFASQFGPRRSSTVPQPQQGLSLSLSPREMVGPVPEITPASAEDVKILGSSSSASGVSSGVSGLQSFLMGSKYLKAAQQLLDEVVNVGQGIKGDSTKGTNSRSPMKSNRESEGTGAGTGEEDTSTKRAADLTTAERQELQMKKAKLVNMLDEVEQRYRQYHHQMQIVITSFEAVAGTGSARTYTALALQTISKQFRCLRDAITGQIRATSRSLGEEDTKSGGSRLRFVDHHLRQQRALQQLGMMQHNAWRPQRGLPERSVSILRAWLFEHFLHPYPKDSDKLMLAKQTGLSRSQVSNWFINARVRLWKPMVEEMYAEEIKDQEQNNTDEKVSKSDANENSASKSSANQENSPTGTGTGQVDSLKTTQEHTSDPKTSSAAMPPSSLGNDRSHASYYDNEAAMLRRPKKARSDESVQPNTMPHSISFDMKSGETSNRELLMKFIGGRQRAGDQGFSLIAGSANNGGNFGAYPIADIGRFDSEQFTTRFSGNGVSLTLGLPHCENLSLSGAQPSFLADESMPSFSNNNPSVAHPSNAYESIDIQNRKRFAAQLLQTL